MTRSVHRVLQNLITSCNLKSVYKTKVDVTIFHKSSSVLQNKLGKMPVITVVAAHRQNHHLSYNPDKLETRAQLVYRRFSFLSCGSVDASASPLLRNTNFGCSRALLTDNGASNRMSPLQAIPRRNYAKGKDKPKSNKSVVAVNEEEMGEVLDVDSMKKQMEKIIEQMKEEFSKQLNIRGASGALETLHVRFEGELYPLQELAQVGRKNPQLAVLNLVSLPDAIQPVLLAIRESGMNLNPQQEGTTIYVPLPKVTREHRENLAKNAKTLFNKYKTNLHAAQNKYIKQIRSQKDISEDLSFRVQQQIMKLTESYVSDAEKILLSKQVELLEQK